MSNPESSSPPDRRRDAAIEARAKQAEYVADIGRSVTEADDASEMLRQCAEAMVVHLGAAFGRVWTVDASSSNLELRASAGLYTHTDGAHGLIPIGSFEIGRIASDRRAHLTNDVLADPNLTDPDWARRERMVAFAGHPLLVGGRLVGVMAMFSRAMLDEDTLASLASGARLVALGIERHNTAQALRLSEALTRSVIDVALDAVISIEPSGAIREWNRAAEAIFGWQSSEAMGQELAEVIVPLRYRSAHREGLARLLSTDEAHLLNQRIEIEALHRDGHEFPVELTISRAITERGTVFHGFVRDITARKQLQAEMGVAKQALERSLTQLELANAAKDEFIGLVSHELKGPITTIMGNAAVLGKRFDDLDAATRGEAFRDIEAEAERLHRVIDDMLILARLEAATGLEREPVRLEGLVRAAFAEHLKRFPRRLLELDVKPGAPVVTVYAPYVDQVLRNLIGNAEKYSPTQETINVVVGQSGSDACISVRDRGPGVAQDELETIFSPFYRAPKTASQAHGIGIGLSVCKRLVEAEGGEIFASLRDGGGLDVTFTLPAVFEDEDD